MAAALPRWWFSTRPRRHPHLADFPAKRQCGHVVPLRAALGELVNGSPQCIEDTIGLQGWALRKFVQQSLRTIFFIPAEHFGEPVSVKKQSRPRLKTTPFDGILHAGQQAQGRSGSIKLVRL